MVGAGVCTLACTDVLHRVAMWRRHLAILRRRCISAHKVACPYESRSVPPRRLATRGASYRRVSRTSGIQVHVYQVGSILLPGIRMTLPITTSMLSLMYTIRICFCICRDTRDTSTSGSGWPGSQLQRHPEASASFALLLRWIELVGFAHSSAY